MQPKKSSDPQENLFQSRLDQIINLSHPLSRLARQINWDRFADEFGPLYVEGKGRPGLPTRLMVGLHYLKHAFNESDEGVVARLLENPYWQYFCGFAYFQHHFPLDPTSLVKWRQRVGEKGVAVLLEETVQVAKSQHLLKQRDLQKVNVDTTVQEKDIAFPTDAGLYYQALRVLVREARRRGIKLRQSYSRVGKKALHRQSRYRHARHMKRAEKETRRLRTYLGRVLRDIPRKCARLDESLSAQLALADRIHHQQRYDKNKVYSMFAPEVECIAKGKARQKYEFGCKVSYVSTARTNWVVGAQALHRNPYDGHTLQGALAHSERLTGWNCREVYCDRGYRGVQLDGESGYRIHLAGKRRKNISRAERRWLKRRSAIEPIIGHLKSDHRLNRNYHNGQVGDKINAVLAGCGFNLKKLFRAFLWLIFSWLKTALGIPKSSIGRPNLYPVAA